jgi:hypothetical protein
MEQIKGGLAVGGIQAYFLSKVKKVSTHLILSFYFSKNRRYANLPSV